MLKMLSTPKETVIHDWKRFCNFLKRVNWGAALTLAYIAVATTIGTYYIFHKIF